MNGVLRLVDSVPEAFATLVAHALTTSPGPHPSVFLSGGGTATDCYRTLSTRSDVDWGAVDVYLGDERCVPPDDPDSNHRMIVGALLDIVGPVHADHPMYRDGTPDAAAAAYQLLVADVGRPDLVHLGLGPDGHTASLFPGSAALDDLDPSHLVVANRDPEGRNPHDRITLTYPAIARAAHVVITVAGPDKHDALARIRSGEDLPAGRVTGDDVVWLVDAGALGGLEPDELG